VTFGSHKRQSGGVANARANRRGCARLDRTINQDEVQTGIHLKTIVEPAAKPPAEYREWDPRCPDVVRGLVAALRPPEFIAIEHVGSTAVPGCGGKGVIDLLALYRDGCLGAAKEFLSAAGFACQGPEFARRWPQERPMYLGVFRWNAKPFLEQFRVS